MIKKYILYEIMCGFDKNLSLSADQKERKKKGLEIEQIYWNKLKK